MTELERVMHIDDDLSLREVTRMALEAVGGLTVMSCSSGADGLEKLSRFAPQLVLLDVMMPQMDGPQTLHRLRQISGAENLPVVFMTTKTQPQEVQRYQQLGAAGVVSKPFDPMTLADQLRDIWSRTSE